jgi:hypothetical protein
MQKETKKKKWEKPKLLILSRGKPGEAMLAMCKSNGIRGPAAADNGCIARDGFGRCTGPCTDASAS